MMPMYKPSLTDEQRQELLDLKPYYERCDEIQDYETIDYANGWLNGTIAYSYVEGENIEDVKAWAQRSFAVTLECARAAKVKFTKKEPGSL
jgi:hypothetical protein